MFIEGQQNKLQQIVQNGGILITRVSRTSANELCASSLLSNMLFYWLSAIMISNVFRIMIQNSQEYFSLHHFTREAISESLRYNWVLTNIWFGLVWFMVSNATFNNISVFYWLVTSILYSTVSYIYHSGIVFNMFKRWYICTMKYSFS